MIDPTHKLDGDRGIMKSFAVGGLCALVAVAQGQTGPVGPNGVRGPWATVNESFLCFWDPLQDRNTTAASDIICIEISHPSSLLSRGQPLTHRHSLSESESHDPAMVVIVDCVS